MSAIYMHSKVFDDHPCILIQNVSEFLELYVSELVGQAESRLWREREA